MINYVLLAVANTRNCPRRYLMSDVTVIRCCAPTLLCQSAFAGRLQAEAPIYHTSINGTILQTGKGPCPELSSRTEALFTVHSNCAEYNP